MFCQLLHVVPKFYQGILLYVLPKMEGQDHGVVVVVGGGVV